MFARSQRTCLKTCYPIAIPHAQRAPFGDNIGIVYNFAGILACEDVDGIVGGYRHKVNIVGSIISCIAQGNID